MSIYENTWVIVVVFNPETGLIRQATRCHENVKDLQHPNWRGHDYMHLRDAPALNVRTIPHEFMVDMATRALVPRTVVNDGDRSHKEAELHQAHAAATTPTFDLTHTLLKLVTGDDSAKTLVQAHVNSRATHDQKLAGLLGDLGKAKTVADVNRIQWGDK